MMGPMTLASTRTWTGVWEIVYRLHILVQMVTERVQGAV